MEIDLHGLSVELAEARILHTLSDQAGREGMEVRFVHGKGLGILADLVDRVGRRDPRVASVDRSFLNPGVTTYTLSGSKGSERNPRAHDSTGWDLPVPPVRRRKR